jgi:hypothetical protein
MPAKKELPLGTLVTVNEAKQKLEFLARNREAAERGGYATSFKDFARRIMEVRVERGLETKVVPNFRNTLLTAAEKNKIDGDTEQIIAMLCSVNVASPVWRQGTAKEFKDEYTGVQFLVERAPSWSIGNAVSVQIFFPQDGKASEWPFDIEVVCQRAELQEIGLSISINRAVLRVEWDQKKFPLTHASRAKDRNAQIQAISKELEAKRAEATVLGGDRSPGWELANLDRKHLGIVSLDRCCNLHGIEDGLEVCLTMTVFDKDLNAEIVPAAIVEEGAPFVLRADGQPLGANKTKVLQAIAARSLKQYPDQQVGSAVLASDPVKFQKR